MLFGIYQVMIFHVSVLQITGVTDQLLFYVHVFFSNARLPFSPINGLPFHFLCVKLLGLKTFSSGLYSNQEEWD